MYCKHELNTGRGEHTHTHLAKYCTALMAEEMSEALRSTPDADNRWHNKEGCCMWSQHCGQLLTLVQYVLEELAAYVCILLCRHSCRPGVNVLERI